MGTWGEAEWVVGPWLDQLWEALADWSASCICRQFFRWNPTGLVFRGEQRGYVQSQVFQQVQI